MDIEILEDLGLTNAEIKTYLALLDLGSSTAGAILEKSALQNSVIHRALNSLIEKGLINYVLEGKRKVYQATDPEQFLHFIDEKKERFQKLLPELKMRQKLAPSKESATIFKGIRGLKEIYHFMIDLDGKEYNTFGGGKDCLARMGETWWLSMHTKRIANKLKSRQVFDETIRPHDNKFGKRPLTKVRYLSADFAQFQETIIVGDYVAITVFTERPYGFLIHDAEVAKGYKKYFELLWNIAKV